MSNILKLGLLVLFIFTSVFGQGLTEDENDETSMIRSRSLYNTKSLEKYYQNIFDFRSNKSDNSLIPSFDLDKEELLKKLKDKIPLDGPVDPKLYPVGPGDIFAISILGNVPIEFTAAITPEGSLLIPNFGSIDVKNLSLEQFKIEVIEKLRRDYLKGEISLTLLSPRIFTVNVSGVIANPGSYFATATQRVDAVIYQSNFKVNGLSNSISQMSSRDRELVNNQNSVKYIQDDEFQNVKREHSLRNILVIRSNGDTLNADLIKYYATGDLTFNPYLSDGDRIIVPNLDMTGNSIAISGAVRLEGTYEYSIKDSLKSVFDIAQKPTNLADLEKIDLYRLDFENNSIIHKQFSYTKLLNGTEENIPLKRGDRIVVREKYPRFLPMSVKLQGEVRRPGNYPILKDKTKLTDVIKLAGGFTTDAHLASAKIVRSNQTLDLSELNPDYERLMQMRLSDTDREEREYFNLEAAIKRNLVSVDFNKLFIEMDTTKDVYLEDNDVILIPRIRNTVFVYGQVINPGHLNYIKGANSEYYVDLAGGFGDYAVESNVKIIKAGSKNWIDPGDTDIEPGDTIWVPREKERDFGYYFSWFAQIIGVAGGVATVYLLLKK